MLSVEVVCCKYLPSITEELSTEANSLDHEQTAPRSSLIWVHTVCHRGYLNISADKKKQTTFVAIGALRVNNDNICLFDPEI